MSVLEIITAGSPTLDVRAFSVREAISSPFEVSVTAHAEDPSLDLSKIVGQPAAFRAITGYAFALDGGVRQWSGLCSHAHQVKAEPTGLSTYVFTIVPTLWVLGHRRNNRIFQHVSVPDLLDELLGEWGIERRWQIERSSYPRLEYKVQYAESDLAFVSRLMEEAGLAFTFAEDGPNGTMLTLGDALHGAVPRSSPPLHYVDHPSESAEMEFVTELHFGQEVRPGALTVQDYDLRRPALSLRGEAHEANAPEDQYEQFHYRPGALLVEGAKGGHTPTADDKGVARHEKHHGDRLAERGLSGVRMGREGLSFHTNAADLRPGTVFSVDHHPHPRLTSSARLLVTDFTLSGTSFAAWSMSGHAVLADVPFRMPLRTRKPSIRNIQSAVVVGPRGEEIHTDEFGRVRVQFHWDREGQASEGSSCWIRVSQGWGGRGYGMQLLPRIGQEVLVSFLDGNPDQPVVVGRVFNQTNPVPYKLPENKTISTWKSDSSVGSVGFNEIKFEDKKGHELFYQQAERNQRTLVKHNETITVLRNRDKDVKHNETDTTLLLRTEVTGLERTEKTGAFRTTIIGGNRQKWVHKNEVERTEKDRKERVGKDKVSVVKGQRRVRIEKDSDLTVRGNRKQKTGKSQSLTVGENQQEVVKGNHALSAGKEIHLKAGKDMIGEGHDVTLRGPGGFIRIDASGVTIHGTVVKINVGGSSGKGRGSKPVLPDEAKEPGKVEKSLARKGFEAAVALPKFIGVLGSPSLGSLIKGGAAFLPKVSSLFGVKLSLGGGLFSKVVGGIVGGAILAAKVSPQIKKLLKDIGKWASYATKSFVHWLFTAGWNAVGAEECPGKGDAIKPKTALLTDAEKQGLDAAKANSDVTAYVKLLLTSFSPVIHQDPKDAYPISIGNLLKHSTIRSYSSSEAVSSHGPSIAEHFAVLFEGAKSYGAENPVGNEIPKGVKVPDPPKLPPPPHFLDVDLDFAQKRGPDDAVVYGRAIKVRDGRLRLDYCMIRAGSYLPNPSGPYDVFEHQGDGESASVYIRQLAAGGDDWILSRMITGGHKKKIDCCAQCCGAPPDGTPQVFVGKGSHATAPSGEERRTMLWFNDIFDATPLSYTLRTPAAPAENKGFEGFTDEEKEHAVVFTQRCKWGNPHWFSPDGAMLGTPPYPGYPEACMAASKAEGEGGARSDKDECGEC